MTKSQGYIFYDIETTGLNPCFDQVVQFGAIRTDPQFNKVDETTIWIRLSPDTIPSPDALLTHRLPLSQIQQGQIEYDGVKQIHTLLNSPNFLNGGYNTLSFDDEFLRFSFYRNLLTPYQHQWANGCRRFDVFRMIVPFFLFRNDALTWPVVDGKTSLKLERLNALNNLSEGIAHDAMADVKVTLALAKHLMAHDPEMATYILGYFDKKTEQARIGEIASQCEIENKPYTIGLLLDPKVGSVRNYIAPVLCLGMHREYTNQMVWLRLDTEDFVETATEDVSKLWSLNKKWGDGNIIVPVTDRYEAALSGPVKESWRNRVEWLTQNGSRVSAMADYFLNYTFEPDPDRDLDSALYDGGFPSRKDEGLAQRFHNAGWDQKLGFYGQFEDASLSDRIVRIIGRHDATQLPEKMQAEFGQYLDHVWCEPTEPPLVDYKGRSRLTTAQALERLQALQSDGQITPMESQIISAVYDKKQRLV